MIRNALLLAAMVIVATACAELAGSDADNLSPAEVAELSDGLIQDGMAESSDTSSTSSGMMSSRHGGMSGDTMTFDIARTHSCYAGGEVTMEGTATRIRDRETRSGSMEMAAARTFTDCARPLADTTVTITLDGSVDMSASRVWESGMWNGTQEVTIQGAIDWQTDDGRSGTCEIDIQASFEMGSGNRNVLGEACGEELEGLGGWSFGPMGQGPGSGNHGPHHGGG